MSHQLLENYELLVLNQQELDSLAEQWLYHRMEERMAGLPLGGKALALALRQALCRYYASLQHNTYPIEAFLEKIWVIWDEDTGTVEIRGEDIPSNLHPYQWSLYQTHTERLAYEQLVQFLAAAEFQEAARERERQGQVVHPPAEAQECPTIPVGLDERNFD